jgi:hypothetical protein
MDTSSIAVVRAILQWPIIIDASSINSIIFDRWSCTCYLALSFWDSAMTTERETRMIQPCALHCWSSHGLTTDTHDTSLSVFPSPILLAAALSSCFLMFAVICYDRGVRSFWADFAKSCPALCFWSLVLLFFFCSLNTMVKHNMVLSLEKKRIGSTWLLVRVTQPSCSCRDLLPSPLTNAGTFPCTDRSRPKVVGSGYFKAYSKVLEYRVKTAAFGTLKRYSIFSLTLYIE